MPSLRPKVSVSGRADNVAEQARNMLARLKVSCSPFRE